MGYRSVRNGSPSTFVNHDKKCAFGLAFILTYAFVLVTRWGFLGDFLDEDDTIYLTRMLLDSPLKSGFNQHGLLDIFASFGSISILKQVPILALGSCSGVIALLFRMCAPSTPIALAVMVGAVLATIPISTDQIVFVTSSHPTIALCFMLVGVLMFMVSAETDKWAYVSYIAVSSLALMCAATFSPVGRLAPVALPLWILVSFLIYCCDWNRKWLYKSSCGFFLSSLFAFVYYVALFKLHHYVGQKGYIEFTLDRILQNLEKSIIRLIEIYSAWDLSSSVVLIIVGALLFVAFWRWGLNSRKDPFPHARNRLLSNRKLLMLSACTLILAALTFGPGSVVVAFQDRYMVAPLTLALLSICSFAYTLTEAYPKRSAYSVFVSVFIVIFVANGLQAYSLVRADRQVFLDTHKSVKKMVEEEASRWEQDAQVVILLSEDEFKSPTRGYNHWSTWYLRYLSGIPEIIGLLGYEKWIDEGVFVEQYRDHGSEYWDDSGDRKRRIRMKGLERDRPMYVYQQQPSGYFEIVDHIIFGVSDGLNSVSTGYTLEQGIGEEIRDICRCGTPNILVWPGMDLVDEYMNTGSAFADSYSLTAHPVKSSYDYSFDGTSMISREFKVKKNRAFRLHLTIENASRHELTEYNEHNPPMPVLAPSIAIYQRGHGISIANRGNGVRREVPRESHGEIDLVLEGIDGCVVLLMSDGELLGKTPNRSIGGVWQFGRGFLQRYWEGQVEIEFYVEG